MGERNNKGITLSIETAVLGGSISLLEDGQEIASWIGGNDVSRSEDLLQSISDLLERTSVGLSEIRLIGVSTGPGSYTGIRVGAATALGLKNALSIPCIGVPVLAAINGSLGIDSARTAAAVPIGRGDVCLQFFGFDSEGQFIVESWDRLSGLVAANSIGKVFLHEDLYVRADEFDSNVEIINAGPVMARYIGLAAEKSDAAITGEIIPIYVRDFV